MFLERNIHTLKPYRSGLKISLAVHIHPIPIEKAQKTSSAKKISPSYDRPLIVFIYTIAIVLCMLSLFQYVAGENKMMYCLSVLVASIYALYHVLKSLMYHPEFMIKWFSIVTFFEHRLGWMLPVFIAAVIGYGLDFFQKNATCDILNHRGCVYHSSSG